METIFLYPIKVLVCSAIFYLYYWIALRNKRFHYYNRFYLLFAFFTSILLPLVQLNWFYLPVENNSAVYWLQGVTISANEIPQGFVEKYVNVKTISITLFILVTFILLVGLLLRIAKIYAIRKTYTVQKMGDVDFINTPIQQAPFSFLNMLFWRNDISLKSQSGQKIFKHELSHIKEKHSWDKLFVQAINCFFWYNPFFYFMQKELSLVHEFIADEKSVGDEGTAAFAEMLLEANFYPDIFSPAQSFFYSPIKRRILMLTTSKKPRYSYARRLFVLPLLAVTTLLFAFKMQQKDTQNPETKFHISNVTLDTIPYYGIYNGKKIYGVKVMVKEQLVEITLQDNTKKTMTVEEAKKNNIQLPPPPPPMPPSKNGQAEITTIELSNDVFGDKKNNQSSGGDITLIADTIVFEQDNLSSGKGTIQLQSKISESPLYVLNGKLLSLDEMKNTNPNTIYSINVLKGESATKKYGDKGKNGVIELITKDENTNAQKPSETVENSKDQPLKEVTLTEVNQTYEKEFTQVQTQASFPGGQPAWIAYLQRNLNIMNVVKANAPKGKYTVVVSFLVDENGNLSEVKAMNDPGFGTAAEAVSVIQKGPRWVPAEQNGKKVKYRQKQPITFFIN